MAEFELTENDAKQLEKQNSRMISEFKANKLESDARKNWDIFYKRNETKFFKDRHWTTREFQELLGQDKVSQDCGGVQLLLEVGCGVGNFAFPLIEELDTIFIYCCDFSPRAVQFVRDNPLYDQTRMKAFQCDITSCTNLADNIPETGVDIVSAIFVLSSIHPDNHQAVFKNLASVLKPGGVLLFRDYGVYDMTMIRFGPGSKIQDRFYSRQDGTRSYFFNVEEIARFAEAAGLQVAENQFVSRRTINKKEGVDVPRTFVQSKLIKPA